MVCLPCIDKASQKCPDCNGLGYYDGSAVKVSYSAHAMVSAIFRYMGDARELPDTCSYLDLPAYFDDYVSLVYTVKNYWSDKKDQTNKMLNMAKQRA